MLECEEQTEPGTGGLFSTSQRSLDQQKSCFFFIAENKQRGGGFTAETITSEKRANNAARSSFRRWGEVAELIHGARRSREPINECRRGRLAKQRTAVQPSGCCCRDFRRVSDGGRDARVAGRDAAQSFKPFQDQQTREKKKKNTHPACTSEAPTATIGRRRLTQRNPPGVALPPSPPQQMFRRSRKRVSHRSPSPQAASGRR